MYEYLLELNLCNILKNVLNGLDWLMTFLNFLIFPKLEILFNLLWRKSSTLAKVEDFLQRRLNNISNFGKIKKFKNVINQSNPFNTFFKILQRFNSSKYSYKSND